MNIEGLKLLPPQIKLRWLTIACFEIQIQGYSIIIDPCIGVSENAPFGQEVIDNADMILLSHGHWDHITDIKALMERFDCNLLCGELTAPAMLRYLNCNPCKIYPVTPNLELDFSKVKVQALFGRHSNQRKTSEELMRNTGRNPVIQGEAMIEAYFYGNMEYRNYLITTPSGLKILFWGSNATDEQFQMIKALKPDIAMMQYTKQPAEYLAQAAKEAGIKVLIPHHMDLHHSEEEYLPRIDKLESVMKDISPNSLLITPERLKWYSFGGFVQA